MQKKTMIIGSGSCARSISEDLLEKGVDIIIAAKDETFDSFLSTHARDGSVEILTQTRLLKCRGSIGNFSVFMDQKGQRVEKEVSNIIIAEEHRREPNFALYGLTSSDRVMTVSGLKDLLINSRQEDFLSKGETIVILNGISQESNPVIVEEIMILSLDLQSKFQKQVYILTRNLKVAGEGLEALYRNTKDAGVVYVKFSDTSPSIDQKEDGTVVIEFFDEITRQQFRLTPGITVADETIEPLDYLSEVADILKLDKDDSGFAQADNVRRNTIYTNRKGILTVGPARTVQTDNGHLVDVSNAALCAFELLQGKPTGPDIRAEIDQSRCVRCLTCYRLCPYFAIRLDVKPAVAPDACEGCGICVAECPRGTINIKGLSVSDITDELIKPVIDKRGNAFNPFIVAFCCSRSAAGAGELASRYGHDLPVGLKIIEVPCGGGISYDLIFSAFKKGADGVMVLTCHKDNCHSEKGNIYARRRVNGVLDFLKKMDFEKERIIAKTLAANMEKEFSDITMKFEKQIIDLGPSRIGSRGK